MWQPVLSCWRAAPANNTPPARYRMLISSRSLSCSAAPYHTQRHPVKKAPRKPQNYRDERLKLSLGGLVLISKREDLSGPQQNKTPLPHMKIKPSPTARKIAYPTIAALATATVLSACHQQPQRVSGKFPANSSPAIQGKQIPGAVHQTHKPHKKTEPQRLVGRREAAR